jgi:hypothetical protein
VNKRPKGKPLPQVIRELAAAPTPAPVVKRRIIWGLRRGRDLSSKLIGYFGAGYFSHVDVRDEEGWWWGARSDEVYADKRYWPKGFQCRPPDYNATEELWEFTLEVTEEQYQAFWRFTKDQERKPYDWRAIIAFALPFAVRRNWRDPAQWFCSEEQTGACEAAGIFSKLWERVTRVTPGEFAQMLTGARASYQRIVR